MQIVFLDSDLSRHDFYKAVLKEIASEDEIHFISHPILFLDYFRTKVIPNQLHVDLIISDTVFPSDTFKDNIDFIRSSQETYSYHNFKLSSIPIVLHTAYFDSDEIRSLDVNKIIPKPLDENNNRFATDLLNIVKDWRKSIYDDLEILGIGLDFNFSKADLGYAVRVKSEKTKILSKAFLFKQQKLPYQWLNKNFFEMEFSIEELETLVNHYMELPKNKLEKERWEDQLQDFFKRNPKFLFANNYSQYWSQPKLDIPKTKNLISQTS